MFYDFSATLPIRYSDISDYYMLFQGSFLSSFSKFSFHFAFQLSWDSFGVPFEIGFDTFYFRFSNLRFSFSFFPLALVIPFEFFRLFGFNEDYFTSVFINTEMN